MVTKYDVRNIMKTISLPPQMGSLYQSIEKRKAAMLNIIDALTDEQRRESPAPAEWSPLQVMEHVVVVEEWMANPLPPGNDRILLKGRLFILLGVGSMRRGLRMPTLPEAAPCGDTNFAVIRERWENARERIAARLETITPETRPSPIALHPVAGPLNAQQTLQLLDAHLTYHLRYFPHVTKG